MHNGNVKTLEEAIVHHSAMSNADRDDILEFLRTLTDEPLLHDPKFANPN